MEPKLKLIVGEGSVVDGLANFFEYQFPWRFNCDAVSMTRFFSYENLKRDRKPESGGCCAPTDWTLDMRFALTNDVISI